MESSVREAWVVAGSGMFFSLIPLEFFLFMLYITGILARCMEME